MCWYKKAIAIMLCASLAAGMAGCSMSKAQDKPVDVEEQRAQFALTAQNRKLAEDGGVTRTPLLETDGDILVSADCPEIPQNQTVSAELKAFVDGEVQQFKTEASDMGAPDEKNGLYNFTLTYKPYAVGADLLGIKFTETAFSGKTDRKNYIQTFSYDLKSSQRLGLDDVFDSSQDYLTQVASKVKESLVRNEALKENMDEALLNEGVTPTIQNFSNFIITPEKKILFYFNRGAVAPVEAGAIEVCIPLAELESLLNTENKAMILGGSSAAAGAEAAEGATQEGEAPAESEVPAEGDAPAAQSVELDLFPTGDNFMKPHSIDGIDINGKVVALTMDDGPSKNTPAVLDALKEAGVKATFFIIGENIKGREDILKRAYDEGHEIGNHSWDHTSFQKISLDDVLSKQIGRTNDAIEAATGKRTIIDRPPYGAMSKDLAAQIKRPQIMWTADTEDWKNKDADASVEKAMNELSDGGMVLWHDLHSTAPGITKKIIQKLKDKGYQFVTVTQLMQIAKLRGDDVGYYFTRAPKAEAAAGDTN